MCLCICNIMAPYYSSFLDVAKFQVIYIRFTREACLWRTSEFPLHVRHDIQSISPLRNVLNSKRFIKKEKLKKKPFDILAKKCWIVEVNRNPQIARQSYRETQYKNNLKFLISTIKPFIAPTDCSQFNAIQHTYSELWITRYVDRVRSEIIGRMPFAERSRAIWFKALYSWVHSLHGNQLECDSGPRYLRIPEYTRNDSTFWQSYYNYFQNSPYHAKCHDNMFFFFY